MDKFTSSRTLGMTIIGQTGFGKTAFLHNLIMEDIREGRSSIVIDPHGDLSQDLLESVDADCADQVYTLEVSETMPFGLNLYECNSTSQLAIDRVVDNSILVFKRLMQSERDFHPHIEFLLRNTGYTILDNPPLTMAEVSLMFSQSPPGKLFRSNLLKRIDDVDLYNFWQGVEERKGNLAYQYIEPLLNKVSPFTASRIMRLIVGQEHTTIPFSEFLDTPGKTLIVNLPIGVLGEEKTQMLGMTILSLLSEQIYERVNQRRSSRVPIHLYIDEAGLFFSSGTAISKLLKQGRKFGCATHLSFQTLSDLPDREAQSAVLQTGTLVFFQVIGGTDSEILSKQLKVKQPQVDPVPKMRMEPNIKEWDEEVWIDEEAKQLYEKLNFPVTVWELTETKEKRNRLIALLLTKTFASQYTTWGRNTPEQQKRDRLLLMQYECQQLTQNDEQQWRDLLMWGIHYAVRDMSAYLMDEKAIPRADVVHEISLFIENFRRSAPAVSVTSEDDLYIADYMAQLSGQTQTVHKEIEAEHTERQKQLNKLKETHYRTIHHREQDGWIPIKLQEERSSTSSQLNYSRRGPAYIDRTYATTRDIQIYDMVAGTPRPFADIWNEMQANLATLPPYYYYLQTINEQQEIIESQQKSAAPPQAQPYGSEQAEEIRQRSLLYFGRPADQVRRELQERISPFLDGSDDDKPDTGKSGAKPKSGPKGPPIGGAKPYP